MLHCGDVALNYISHITKVSNGVKTRKRNHWLKTLGVNLGELPNERWHNKVRGLSGAAVVERPHADHVETVRRKHLRNYVPRRLGSTVVIEGGKRVALRNGAVITTICICAANNQRACGRRMLANGFAKEHYRLNVHLVKRENPRVGRTTDPRKMVHLVW
jgi:hypothetical protein